jgi:putative peptidoglycan lipid II flippase
LDSAVGSAEDTAIAVPAAVDVTRFASFTLASLVVDRIFAFAFTVLMSAAFGTSAALDTYLLAVAGPIVATTLLGDLIYSLLLPEVVPAGREQHDADPRWNVVVWAVIVLVGLSAAYAGLWAIGVTIFGAQDHAHELLLLGVLTSPLILLGGIAALSATILIAERAYLAAMIRIPLASFVTTLSFVLWHQLSAGVETLAASVLSGALAAALLVSVLAVRALGPLSLTMGPIAAGRLMRRLLGTSVAQLVAGLLGQATIPIERLIGVSAGPGIASALNYGRVLVSPPLLIGQSIATASYPRFVGQSSQADVRRYRDLGRTIGMVIFLLLPLSTLLVMLAGPLVRAAYQRATFDEVAAFRTAIAASALAIGLVPIAVCAVTTRFLYAERASGRVAWLSAFMLVVYGALAIALGPSFTYLGLALASTVSYVFLMTVLLVAVRNGDYRGWDHVPARSLARSCVAALVMLLVILIIEPVGSASSLTSAYVGTFVAAVAGVTAYCAVAFVVRSAELRQAWAISLRGVRSGRLP